MSFLIPEQLETDRLILRMFRLDDLSDIHEYYADYDCTKYTTQRQLEIHESWGKMAALAGHWSLYNYGSYALEEKNLKRVIGFAGLDYPEIAKIMKCSQPAARANVSQALRKLKSLW